MEKLKVRGYLLEVDYPAELEPYMDRLERVRVRGEKVQACSPFRQEKNPSWAVNLDNGSWVDSGAEEEQDRKGSFLTLLAFFRGETWEETSLYLLEKYSHILDDADALKLDFKLSLGTPEIVALGQDKYGDVINQESTYLLNRGISSDIQIYFNCGLGTRKDCIALPWHDKQGRIINIKYRSMVGKEFWFSKNGHPIKNHVYGLFAVMEKQEETVWAVESEIDALYLWAQGIPAIAFGGASMSEKQKSLILNSGINKMVIATDNDVVGHRFAEVLTEQLFGYVELERVQFPEGVKDVNDLCPAKLDICKRTLKTIIPKLTF